MGIYHYDEGAFSMKKVLLGSIKVRRFDKGEKEVPTEGEPLKPRFDSRAIYIGARLPKTKPI